MRLLYINTIQIFYNCFLSIIGNRDGKKKGRGRGAGLHRFGIEDEAAVFTGAAKEDGRSTICPPLLEHVPK